MTEEQLFKKYAKVYSSENDQFNLDYKSFNLLISDLKQLTLTDVVASEKINPPLRDTNTYFEDGKYVNKD